MLTFTYRGKTTISNAMKFSTSSLPNYAYIIFIVQFKNRVSFSKLCKTESY